MKQTAVEWLFQVWIELEHIAPEQWEMAKAMEKEQCLKMLSYDLDELAREEILYNDQKREWWKEGFQKALELLTFKSE
jgi:hypothetical protein